MTSSFALTVNNVAPTLTSVVSSHTDCCDSSADGVASVSGTFSDPGLDTHSVLVNWGDGITESIWVNQLADTFAGSHIYASGGIFTITVTAIDSDGAASSSQTVQAIVQGVGLIDGVLYVIGTDGKDVVRIQENDRRDRLTVDLRLNDDDHHGAHIRETFVASDVDLIVVYVCGGDDSVRIGGDNDDSNEDWPDIEIDAMIFGGAGDDLLRGSHGDDFIDGGEGDDRIFGRRGDDHIVDLSGNNDVRSGRGQDTVTTGNGDDRISTDGGDDLINAGDGCNRIDAGQGNDTITAGSGNDDIDGNQGDDLIDAGHGRNKIDGGLGNDTITAGSGDDDINGNQDNDWINAGDGNNKVDGGLGDDIIISGSGNDRLAGNQGNDVLSAGGGDDTLDGGTGRDVLIGGTGRDQIDGNQDDDLLVGDSTANESNIASLATVMAAWSNGDLAGALLGLGSITDDGVRDDLTGGKGNDHLIGSSGDKLKQ